jgi:hypothetical protein
VGSWSGKKQLVGLVRNSKLSTAAVYKGALSQQNPAQILAAIAVLKQSAVNPANLATNQLNSNIKAYTYKLWF